MERFGQVGEVTETGGKEGRERPDGGWKGETGGKRVEQKSLAVLTGGGCQELSGSGQVAAAASQIWLL